MPAALPRASTSAPASEADPDPGQTIARLERALRREQAAREEAEALLEDKARALFEALESLRRESALANELRLAIEAAQDGIAMTDPAGRFVYMNRTHGTMFGLDAGAMHGRHWSELYGPEERLRFEAEILPELEAHGRWRGEAMGQAAGGAPVFQDLTLTRLPSGGILSATRDVTRRKAEEMRLREMEETLREAERNEAMSRAAQSIAHDFNNLLAAISGYAMLLEGDLAGQDAARERAGRIALAAEQAAGILAQLREPSRAPAPPDTAIDLVRVAQGALGLAEPFRPARIAIVRQFERAGIGVLADEVALSRALVNTLKNAFEAVGARGIVTVRAGEGLIPAPEERPGEVWLGRILREPSAFIAIADNGSGMSAEVLAHIFEPAFSTKRAGAGHGFGLESVRAFVETGGAAVRVRSIPGEGSELAFFLRPCALEAAEARPAAAEPVEKARILIVEDKRAVGELLCTMVERFGHAARWIGDPREALAIFRQNRSAFDLMITDHDMPWLSGEALTARVRRLRPDLPVILYSGEAAYLEPTESFAAILPKPIAPDRLERAIATALRGDR